MHLLGEEAEPVSLKQIFQKLKIKLPERTVRRWFLEMVRKGTLAKYGNRKAVKYQIIKKTQRSSGTVIDCFSIESEQILKQTRQPVFKRMPVLYDEKWMDRYKPNVDFYIPLEKRNQLARAGKRLKFEGPAGTYAHQIYNRLLIDLSYNSSRLEGNTYSLLETEKLLLQGQEASEKLTEEKIMILNHKEAIRYLIDNAPKMQICSETIQTLHFLLADNLIDHAQCGHVRNHGVRISGSVYVPLEDTKRLQMRLEKIVQKASQIENPYEQSLFLLIHIAYLQAFTDVNKRTSRLSANIPLIKHNLVPLSFNDIEKDDYIAAMIAVYEFQDVNPILDLYVFSYRRTCALYDATAKMVGFDEVRVRYRQQRRNMVRDIVVQKVQDAQKYVLEQNLSFLKPEDKDAFIEDLIEDIANLDKIYLGGLGITQDEFQSYLNAKIYLEIRL